MRPFDFIGTYFWIFLLGVSIKFVWPSKEARNRTRLEPDFAYADRMLRIKVYGWMSLPWLMMGVGQLFGGIPSVWHYFRPQDGNPWVLAFFAAVVVVWFAAVYWIYVRDGARAIVEHQLLVGNTSVGPSVLTPHQVKLLLGLILLSGACGLAMMFLANIPIPNLMH